ncbi:cytochrome c biogenesis protein ResB [Demequina sediminicola]|uniref:cytochrome c biogenesis protein ResB n=1 Tax=Demequina sediminicola TaxID=1095026 RepID=UPI000781A79B|nr:cytochrome c biogenesis protein ResB [Demequina sediminicola]
MARLKIDNYAYREVPRLGVSGWLRWTWRQVTSMRVALILLILLALAAIPGSVLPQWPQNAGDTQAFIDANPFWGPLLDATGFLDVFGSAWFTAIYLLLFASLIGCIVPRIGVYWRELHEPVAEAPSRLDRYEPQDFPAPEGARVAIASIGSVLTPDTWSWQKSQTPTSAATEAEAASEDDAQRSGRKWSRPRWWSWLVDYRVRVDERPRRTDDAKRELALSAHKGHIRELGNLLFHVSLIGILLAVAAGSLLTYRGQALIVEGDSFTNAVVAYDSYESGALFDENQLDPWILSLDEFDATFSADGTPQNFTAHGTLIEPGFVGREVEAEVNRPIQVDGAKIYLQGNGYAPRFTVTDSNGEVAFEGAVPFLPQDTVYTSTGVLKVPDVSEGEQLGFKATLLPTEVMAETGPISGHPQLTNPVIYLQAYTGDLGLDSGVPQNVYQLDESQLSPVRGDNGDPLLVRMEMGDTITLPDGLGTVTWESTPRFAAFDLRRDPSLPWLLAASIGSLIGLSMSLFGARRRLWFVAPLNPGAGQKTTVVTAAAWAPAHDQGVREERDRIIEAALGRPTSEAPSPEES